MPIAREKRISPARAKRILKDLIKLWAAIAACRVPGARADGFFASYSGGGQESINGIYGNGTSAFAVGRSDSDSVAMDSFIQKISHSGTVLKAVHYGGTGSDELHGLVADGENVTAVGRETGTDADILVSQFNYDLDPIRHARIDTGQTELCYNVRRVDLGYVMICWTNDGGNQDVAYLFLNDDLSLRCATKLGTAMSEEGRALTCDPDGSCHLLGITTAGADARDWVLGFVDPSCNVQWAKTLDMGFLEEPQDATADASTIAVTGWASTNGARPIVTTFDKATGAVKECVSIGTSGQERGQAVHVQNGRLRVVGWGENVPLQAGGTSSGQAILLMDFPDINDLHNYTAYVLDTAGNEVGKALHIDGDGNIWIGGHTYDGGIRAIVARIGAGDQIDFCGNRYLQAMPTVTNITMTASDWTPISSYASSWVPTVTTWTPAISNLTLSMQRFCPTAPVTTGSTGVVGSTSALPGTTAPGVTSGVTSLLMTTGLLATGGTTDGRSTGAASTTGLLAGSPSNAPASGSDSGDSNLFIYLASAIAGLCLLGAITVLLLMRRRQNETHVAELADLRGTVVEDGHYPLIMDGNFEVLKEIPNEDAAEIEGLLGKRLKNLHDKPGYKTGFLGKGNFSEVYLARAVDDPTTLLAVKDVNGEKECAASKYEEEVMFSIKKLDPKPRVVEILEHRGIRREGHQQALSVMSLCSLGDGRHLRKAMQCLTPDLKAQFTLYFGSQLLETVAQLQRGNDKTAIFHFDLKLENTLMPNSLPLALHVADFGLAHMAEKTAEFPDGDFRVQNWKDISSYFLYSPWRLDFQKQMFKRLRGQDYDKKAHFEADKQAIWEAGLCLLELYLGYNPFFIPRVTPGLATRIMEWDHESYRQYVNAVPTPTDSAGQALFQIIRGMLNVDGPTPIEQAHQAMVQAAAGFPIDDAQQAELHQMIIQRRKPDGRINIPLPPNLSAGAGASAGDMTDYQSVEAAEETVGKEDVYCNPHTTETGASYHDMYNTADPDDLGSGVYNTEGVASVYQTDSGSPVYNTDAGDSSAVYMTP